MTERDEATMPDRPEKAHGDALEDVGGSDSVETAQEPESQQGA